MTLPSKTLEDVLLAVLDTEGWPTYTVHPNDKGGPTKGGITLRTLEGWRHRRCTRAELQRLSKEEALSILRRLYVDANGIHKLTSVLLQAQVIDNAVLSGPSLAVKDLQRTLETVGVDGIIGPQTLSAIATNDVEMLGRRLAVTRTLRLARHVQTHPDQLVFLAGWLTRTLSFSV
jgi:lysozyme family protein